MAGYGLGIDIGTTWTAAAIARAGSEPQVVSLGGRSAAVPTVVHVMPDRSVNVGDAAERRAATDPDRLAREFKRRIGDTTPVLLGGQPWSPESLMATVLQWVVARVTELEGEPPDSVVVTHPANWGPLRRELLEQAVGHVGVTARFVTEPEAAAVHYASATRVPDGTVVAVYDLGGGTFDATVLRKEPAGFALLGTPQGVERLGGLDFDAAVLAHVTSLLGSAWTALDPTDPTTASGVVRLRADCVLAKEALSEDADATISVALPTVATELRLTRGELEAMIRPAIEQSADALARAVAGAGVTAAEVDRILLVGGSSRIPLVSQVLTTRFERPLALDTHPKHAVALGAARLALGTATLAPPVQPIAPVAPVAPVVAAAAATPAWTATPPPAEPPPAEPPPTPPPVEPPPPAAPGPAPLPVPEPAGTGGRRFPIWIPVVVVVAVLGLVAALALGGGGDDGDGGDDAASFDRSDDEGGETFFDPAVVQTLDGAWFYSGFATDCQGLAEEDCAAFEADFSSELFFSCDGESCDAAMGASDPQFLGDDGESGLIASGQLSEDDGFSCDGTPDPTEWQLVIYDIVVDDDDAAESFDATITLTSQGPDDDGGSCVFEQVVADGSASPSDEGSDEDSSGEIVEVTLEWFSNADLDLQVTDSDGADGEHQGDANSGCPSDVEDGAEVVQFTGPLAVGTYTVTVLAFEVDTDVCGSGDYVLTISVPGFEDQVIEGTVATEETQEQTFEVE